LAPVTSAPDTSTGPSTQNRTVIPARGG